MQWPVLDSYRFRSDLPSSGNVGIYNPGSGDNQFVTRFRDEPSNTDELYRISSDKVLDSQRYRSDLTTECQDRIDFSKPMTQLLESLGDLNQNLMGGFNVVAGCFDNWRQSMRTHLSGHDDMLSKLEQTLSALRSSLGKAQAVSSDIGMKQSRMSSMVDQQENLVSNLNHEAMVSSKRVRTTQPSMESRMRELGNRIEEIRDFDMNERIPPGVIQ